MVYTMIRIMIENGNVFNKEGTMKDLIEVVSQLKENDYFLRFGNLLIPINKIEFIEEIEDV